MASDKDFSNKVVCSSSSNAESGKVSVQAHRKFMESTRLAGLTGNYIHNAVLTAAANIRASLSRALESSFREETASSHIVILPSIYIIFRFVPRHKLHHRVLVP